MLTESAAALHPSQPTRIGRYDVKGVLGQGGMGRVLLARDTVLGRDVAIKVLRDDLALPPEVRTTLFERMRHEAMAAAALAHPHMVTLHDMGEEEPVGLYLVFERVKGPTLREKIADGPVPPAEVAVLARELGGALSNAHAAGVIHRDVKPENVMIGEHGAKLTDFGIARLPDSTLTVATRTTLGTPAYSAPEALAQGEFSAGSDQFSLAATLHEALSGRRAFPGDDALTVAGRVALDAPAPLTTGLPQDHDWIERAEPVLRRAMSKDPKDRFPSAKTFGETLADALVRTRSPWMPSASELPTPIMTTPLTAAPSLARDDGPARSGPRSQNVIIGAALVILATLVVWQRKTPDVASGDGASLKVVATSFNQALAAPRGGSPATASGAALHHGEHHHGLDRDGGAGDGGIEAFAPPAQPAPASATDAGASSEAPLETLPPLPVDGSAGRETGSR